MAEDRNAEKVARLALAYRSGNPLSRRAPDYIEERWGQMAMMTDRKPATTLHPALGAPYDSAIGPIGARASDPAPDLHITMTGDRLSTVYDPAEGEPPLPPGWTEETTVRQSRSDVPAALADNLRTHLPYSFRGQRCSLHQLRVVLADACQWDGQLPRMLMDDRGLYLRQETGRGRVVKFTRAIDADGVSVIDPDWIEE